MGHISMLPFGEALKWLNRHLLLDFDPVLVMNSSPHSWILRTPEVQRYVRRSQCS